MEYCTVQDVRDMIKDDMLNGIIGNEYIEDVDEREARIIPKIEEAITDAEAEIDGYLNKRYSVPIKPVPRVINKFAKDIAVYNLVSRMGIDESTREKTVKDRYESAIKYLLEVSKGTIEIGTGSGQEGGAKNGRAGDFRVRSNERLFSRTTMKGW